MGCENEMEMVIEKGSGVRVCDLLTLNKQEYKLNCLLNECLLLLYCACWKRG